MIINKVWFLGIFCLLFAPHVTAAAVFECARPVIGKINNHRDMAKFIAGAAAGVATGFAVAKIGGYDVRHAMKMGLYFGALMLPFAHKGNMLTAAGFAACAGGVARIFNYPCPFTVALYAAGMGFCMHNVFNLIRDIRIRRQEKLLFSSDPEFVRVDQELDEHVRRREEMSPMSVRYDGKTWGKQWWIERFVGAVVFVGHEGTKELYYRCVDTDDMGITTAKSVGRVCIEEID